MKILLIQPPWYGFQNIVSQRLYLGLAYLGAVLEKERHQVKIFNGELFFDNINNQGEGMLINGESYLRNFSANHQVYQKILQAAKTFNPDIVGISFMTANSNSAYILAKLLKGYKPDIPLIAGGVHPTLLPEEPITRGVFDYVVKGEGEITIIELINAIEKQSGWKNILGISYKKNGGIIHNPARPFIQNLDTLPFPAFHLMQDYEKHSYSCKGIITSRGCPFECNYCASNLIWSRRVRFRTPENVVAEIKDRYLRLGVKSFSFHDDSFTINTSYIEKICQGILQLDFKIKWHCDTRGDTLNLELLKLMKRAGCNHIYLGLESGSPKIQQFIKKRINFKKLKTAVKLSRKVGIETTVYFMVGFPGETEADVWGSIKVMKDLRPDYAIWSILTPYPGTEIWQIAANQGLVSTDCNWENFFHHYNRGNLFNSMTNESWDKMLKVIMTEQNKLNKRLSLIKIGKKMLAVINLINLGLKNPNKILSYLKKHLNILEEKNAKSNSTNAGL